MAIERALQGAVRTVERQAWLGGATGVQVGVQSLYEAGGETGRTVKNFLHGTWLGHPLHPVLVSLPIGAWTVAQLLDGAEAATGRRSGERLGMGHADRGGEPADFVPAIPAGDLPEGRPTRIEAAGTAVVLVRQGERVRALAERCSHLGGPLAQGRLEGGGIRCPWHGSRFSLDDGRVIDGPATHPQPCFEARIRNGRVEVRRAAAFPPDQRD